MYYQIMATVVEDTGTGTITHQIPTFYLEPNIQGILDEKGAEKVASDILNPCNNPRIIPHIHVLKVYRAQPKRHGHCRSGHCRT